MLKTNRAVILIDLLDYGSASYLLDDIYITNEEIISNISEIHENLKKIALGSGSYGSIIDYDGKILKMNTDLGKSVILNTFQDNKFIISTEILDGIGAILMNRVLGNQNKSIVEVYGTYIIPYDKDYIIATDENGEKSELNIGKSYIFATLMEKLDIITNDNISKDLWYWLIIIMNTIYIGQSKIRFNHNDLHLGNIMKRKDVTGRPINILINNTIIEIKSKGWIPVLIDFGFCTFDLDQYRVSSDEMITMSGQAFDAYYDVYKIFESLIINRDEYNINIKELVETFLNVESSNADLIDNILIRSSPDHMINVNYLYGDNPYKRILLRPLGPTYGSNVTSLLEMLVKKIDHKIIKPSNTVLRKPVDKISTLVHTIDSSIIINEIATYYNIKYKTNAEPIHKVQEYSKILDVHMVEINNEKRDQYGYQYIASCCKENVFDFVSSRVGIAINGTYFKQNQQPVGSSYYEELDNHSIRRYLDDYAYIVIKNGNLKIKTSLNESEKNRLLLADNVYMSAPLLVNNGKIVMTENKMLTKKYGNYKYACKSDPNNNLDDVNLGFTMNEDEEYLYCDYIEPGVLLHLSNANPRSIIATKGNITYFIVISGRTKNYKGATIEQMNDFLVNYLHVDTAINLDGGASSVIMWSNFNNVYTPINTYSRKTIGNVFGLIDTN